VCQVKVIVITCGSQVRWLKNVLTVKEKLELLETFENGESVTELATDYRVGIDCCVHESILPG
jgi:hypothetical protein